MANATGSAIRVSSNTEINKLRCVARFLMKQGFKFHSASDPVEQVRCAIAHRRDARELLEAADWVAAYDDVWEKQRTSPISAARHRPAQHSHTVN